MKVKDIIKELERLDQDSDLLCITYEPAILSDITGIPLTDIPDFIAMLEAELDLEGLQLDMQTLASSYIQEKQL